MNAIKAGICREEGHLAGLGSLCLVNVYGSSNAQKLVAGLDSHTHTSQWFAIVQCFLPRQHARTARQPTANGGHVVEQGLLRGGLRRKLSPVMS